MSCSFVPPYLLRHLAATAENSAARHCRGTLDLDSRLRSQRSAAPNRWPPATSARSSAGTAQRVIHDARNNEQLPGSVARSDGDAPVGDLAVDEAHDSSRQVWGLFAEEFGRPSVDGAGSTLSVTVHYGQNYDNAFWDGTQLVFGDGDGEVFERFTKPMEVMAHEFSHGVIQLSAGLTYAGQSGALNESVSDAFAAMTKQRSRGQDAAAAGWLIGEGLFRPGVSATALRSMLEPGTAYDDPRLGRDPQVGSMADYVETEEDNGGVHINSGIPNRAFALAAIAIGGPSWERPGRIWYDALTSGEVTADTDFASFAAATVHSAERLFSDDPSVAERVRTAWQQVGVLAESAEPATGPAPKPGATGQTPDATIPWADALRRDPVPAAQARTVAVRRTGGFAGTVRTAQLDLDGDPLGPEVRQLLLRADLSQLAASPPAPDRFVYLLAVDDWELVVPEQDLTPELDQVVRLVLGHPGAADLG